MRPLGRPLLVAMVAAAVVIAASVLITTRRTPAPAPEPPAPRAPMAVAGTAATPPPAGPQGPTLAGARSAALGYLALSEQVVAMDVEAAVAAQREAATTAAAPGLIAELRQRLADLRAVFPGGGVRYRVGPVAVRVTGAGEGRARVEVFYVGVLSAPNVAPYEQWRLSRYDLAWERGAWRVAAETSGPGPRPAAPTGPEPATGASLEAALGGFTSALAP